MKSKSYIKFSLINKTNNDLVNNMFFAYVIGIMECIILAIVINEFNFISISLLIIAACLLCYLAYKKGCQDANKDGSK